MPNLADNLATDLADNLAVDLAGGEIPEILGQPLAAWWRTDEGWDGTSWTDKVAGYVADGTGHAPSTATLNIDHTVLRFNGTTQYLELPSDVAALFEGADYTIAVAYRLTSSAANQTLFAANKSASGTHYVWKFLPSSPTVRLRHNDGANSDSTHANVAYGGYNSAITGFDFGASTRNSLVNGNEQLNTAQTADPVGLNQASIAARIASGTPVFFFTGDIAEICIFSGKLSSADMATLQEYFDARYDIWRKIEALPNLVAAWDPRRGKTLGTGVSDWDDVVNSYTVSQATGTKQPTENLVSSAASGCPSLVYAQASSQLLHGNVLASVANSNNLTAYCALRYTTLYGTQSPLCFGDDSNSTDRLRFYASTGGNMVVQSASTADGSDDTAVGGLVAATDYWQYMAIGSPTDRNARYRGQSEVSDTTPSITQSTLDNTTHGCRKGSGELQFFDGESYGVLVFDTKLAAANHTLAQSYLDDLMGL